MKNYLPILLDSSREVLVTISIVVSVVILLELLLYVLLRKIFHHKKALAYVLVAPAFLGLGLLVLYPMMYNLVLAFSNMTLRRFTPERGLTFNIGNFIANLRYIFTEPVLKQQYFFPLLGRTFLWTGIQVSAHVSLGYGIAMLLNRPMRMRGVYRALILFPWAIPQVIAVLAFRGEFNYEFGYFNIILQSLGIEKIPWMSTPLWNFVAMNITNIWLGVPFMSVVLLGALQSIDRTYYEAAEIDGATKFQCFSQVTLPLIKPVLVPAIILGIIWTFNNFNVPFFINQQELETSDILVTALFRAAFQYNLYGFASALALIIFGILLVSTLVFLKVGRPDIEFEKKPQVIGK